MSPILWYLIIGLIVGWLASMLVKNSGLSLLGAIVVGIVGAEIGGFLFRISGVEGGGMVGSLFTSVVGAVVLLLIIRLVRRRRGRIE